MRKRLWPGFPQPCLARPLHHRGHYADTIEQEKFRARQAPPETAVYEGFWRATVDEDGHYSFAVPL